MRTLTIAVALTFMVGAALTSYTYAEDAACAAKATSKDGKPLAGAAKTSFMKKCVEDACETNAKGKDGKPLAGAAKTSFMKKCVEDGTKT